MSNAAFFLDADAMLRDEGRKAHCPECGWFLTRILSIEAEAELNCANGRCRATLIVVRENEQITVRVIEKSKQA